MDKKREMYEQKSEILLKKLMSKFYSLEANYLETKMNAQKMLNKIGEQLPDGKEQLQKLQEKQEKLTNFYREMMASSQDALKETSKNAEESANKIVDESKQNFTERTQGWLNSLGGWITEMEERTENTSGQLRDQLRSQVDQLKTQQTNLRGKIKELQETTGENWEKINSSISDEVNAMTSSIDKFYQHLFSKESREIDEKEA
jgi:exonuclease VII large subunit